MALLSNISTGCNSILVRELVEKCDNFNPVNTVNDSFFEDFWVKIYVNGTLIGLTKKPVDLYEELRVYKECCMFSNQVSFTTTKMIMKLEFCVIMGVLFVLF